MDVTFPEMRYSGMETSLQKRLKMRIDMMGTNAFEVATKAGLGPSFVRDILRGKSKNPGIDKLEKLATALGTTVEWFTSAGETEKKELGDGVGPATPLNEIQVVGKIQAGTWLDSTLVDEDYDRETIPMYPDPRFPRAKQYGLKVVGDSMDLEYPDGSYVTCVDFIASGLGTKVGLTVHVERHTGPLVEATLKVIELVDGKLTLVPRSSNPKHKPIPIEGDGGTVIEIRGVVTGSYRRTAI